MLNVDFNENDLETQYMGWDVKIVMGLNNMVACDSKKSNPSVILKGVYLKNILSFSEL